jgi:general secretion pathway protein M
MKRTDLRTRFDALNAREQRWLLWGAVAAALLLVLGLGVWPALHSWRASAPAHQQMAQQLQVMQGLQARAQVLQAAPRFDADEGLRQLQEATLDLGERMQLSAGPQQMNVRVQALPAQALAQWLASARELAHAVPLQAQLSQSSETGPALWSGTLVLALPPR